MRYRRNIHIPQKQIIYGVIILSLLIGVGVGAVFANHINPIQNQELTRYVDDFFVKYTENSIEQTYVLKNSLLGYGKVVLFFWILGFTVIGMPLVAGMMGIKGFTYGFTSAFLIRQYGFQGILFGIISYLPQNLILLPVFIFISSQSMQFALAGLTNKQKKGVVLRKHQWIEYGITLLVGMGFISLVSMIETYITPLFIKIFLPSFIL